MTGSIAVSQCGHTPNRPGHHGTVVARTVGTVAISCNATFSILTAKILNIHASSRPKTFKTNHFSKHPYIKVVTVPLLPSETHWIVAKTPPLCEVSGKIPFPQKHHPW